MRPATTPVWEKTVPLPNILLRQPAQQRQRPLDTAMTHDHLALPLGLAKHDEDMYKEMDGTHIPTSQCSPASTTQTTKAHPHRPQIFSYPTPFVPHSTSQSQCIPSPFCPFSSQPAPWPSHALNACTPPSPAFAYRPPTGTHPHGSGRAGRRTRKTRTNWSETWVLWRGAQTLKRRSRWLVYVETFCNEKGDAVLIQ